MMGESLNQEIIPDPIVKSQSATGSAPTFRKKVRIPVVRSERYPKGRRRRDKILLNFQGMPVDFFDTYGT